MKMKLLSYCFLTFLLPLIMCKGRQAGKPVDILHSDTLQNISEFRIVVEDALMSLKANPKLSKEEAIRFTKIYNSIYSYELDEKSADKYTYKTFYDLYGDKYLYDISQMLEGEVSLGMGYYCPKYKLYIGGPSFPPCSYIEIRELRR